MVFTEARRAIGSWGTIRCRGSLVIAGCAAMLWAAGCGGGGGTGASLQQRSVTAAAPLFELPSGEPFFPIGIYSANPPSDHVFGQLKEAGFNTAHTYASQLAYLESYLNACESYGLKGLVPPGRVRDAAAFADGAHLANVPTLRSAPALLAWYLVDEPELQDIPAEVVAGGRADILELDSQSSIAIVVYRRERYSDYAGATDVLMTDIYPIRGARNWPLRSVGDAVWEAIDATANAKPVWAVVQAFGYQNEVNNGWGHAREPTVHELRAMTYLAIVQGTSGIFFYAYHGSRYYIEDSPEFWQAVKDVAGEINALLPCLVRPPAAPVTMSLSRATSQIYCTTRTDGQSSYLIAVNAGPEPASAHFRLSGQPQMADVLFEGRSVDVEAGVLADRFDAYAVHVYRY